MVGLFVLPDNAGVCGGAGNRLDNHSGVFREYQVLLRCRYVGSVGSVGYKG